MRIDVRRAAEWMGAQGGVGTGTVAGWSIDSRTTAPGDVFFALRGPNHDGHDFVAQLAGQGVISVVEREIPAPAQTFLVDDTLLALQRLARHARRSWGGQVIGVTGSAGKTTTKDVIAHLLAVRMPTGKTVGNFNNHVGLPLSILRLPDDCRVAVLEMGMNHAGEIHHLASLAEPDIAVVTNVGYAHIEFFRSIEGIALAKRELVEALPAGGVAVLNADDPLVAAFARIHRGRSITYGFSDHADVRAADFAPSSNGSSFTCNGASFHIPLSGMHGVRNVLAGIAVAQLFDIGVCELVDAAQSIPVGKMRGERIDRNGLTIWNDAYNANPEAMRSMLDVLALTPAPRHIAVLGEMLELGERSETLHREIGDYAAAAKIDLLVGIRGMAQAMVEEAVRAGMRSENTLFFEDPADAGEALRKWTKPGDAILFKGSRGVRVERALESLLEGKG